MEIVARVDQVVFGPVLPARGLINAGRLVDVAVRGWDVRSQLYFAANGDRVRANDQRAIIAALQGALELDPSARSLRAS